MATCKDCIHYDACVDIFKEFDAFDEIKAMDEDEVDNCKEFKDKSRFVKLPCNVGDEILKALEKRENTLKMMYGDHDQYVQGFEDAIATVEYVKEESEAKSKEMSDENTN